MFDILMYLFETLIHNESDFHVDQEALTDELVLAGFHLVNVAITNICHRAKSNR